MVSVYDLEALHAEANLCAGAERFEQERRLRRVAFFAQDFVAGYRVSISREELKLLAGYLSTKGDWAAHNTITRWLNDAGRGAGSTDKPLSYSVDEEQR